MTREELIALLKAGFIDRYGCKRCRPTAAECLCEMDARTAFAIFEATVIPQIIKDERERCATLKGQVYTYLTANGHACACGNGRVPISAYLRACIAYSVMIRNPLNGQAKSN